MTIGLAPSDQSSPLGQLWTETTDGHYEIRIPAGSYKIYFAGGVRGYEPVESEPVTVKGKVGEETSVDFQLKPRSKPSRVTGKVLDSDGRPVKGADIFIYAGWEFRKYGTTNSEGNFAIEAPAEIKDDVRIYATDGPRRSQRLKTTIARPIELILSDKTIASVHGRVVDEAGLPIQNADINVEADGWSETLTTDDTGRFACPDAWSNTDLNVRCEEAGYGRVIKKATAAPGENLDLGELVLVKADQTLDGLVVDADGHPAMVELGILGTGQPQIHGKSDLSGKFHLTGLIRGKINVSAFQTLGGRSVTLAHAEAQAGDTNLKIVIKSPSATLHGRLVDTEKQPVAGAMILADDFDQPGEISATSANDGTFQIKGLFPGWLSLRVMPSKNSKDSVRLRAKTGDEESLVVLPAHSRAAQADTPIPDAERAKVGSTAPQVEAAVWLNTPPLPPQNLGKVRILDFWNIFCGPCIANLPKQQEFWEAHRREGLEMVALHPAWNEQEVREFLAARPGIHFPIAIEKEGTAVSDHFFIEGVPTYVVIGPDRKVAFVGAGDWEGAKARATSLLQDLAKKQEP
jgi:protocatechuate 3,4-dioxygenase beta subunit